MEHPTSSSGHEHMIDVPNEAAAAAVPQQSYVDNHDDHVAVPSTGTSDPPAQAPLVSAATVNVANTSLNRRGDNYGRRHRSPLNSGVWISIEVFVNVSQIIAAIVVLSLSRKERPQAPLYEWVVGYTVGCFATLPHLYWRYIHRNTLISEQEQPNALRNSPQSNPSESISYTSGSATNSSVSQRTAALRVVAANPRINALFDHFKMALDCFFAVWFVVGNVWIFGGHSSASNAPNLYRLCIVFLTFSCIGYAMPFILCAMICCCLPCIISIMGFREDVNNTRGATSESINALLTYKFKCKKRRGAFGGGGDSNSEGEGGILAAGTDRERIISAEDAVCCICLAKFNHNDELRELPCSHFFHKDCVDKWLKINALCPLCKAELGNSSRSRETNQGDGGANSSSDISIEVNL